MIPEIDKIHVYYRDTFVGTIQRTPDKRRSVFEYDRNWLADGFSLSPTELPLSTGLKYGDKDKFNGNFATFEDSLPDGYGLYLLQKILKQKGSSLNGTTPFQRLAIVGDKGMGALSYRPFIDLGYGEEMLKTDNPDILQGKALNVLAERNSEDTLLLYYRSSNSGGARPKITAKMEDGTHWLIKFRHETDSKDIGRDEYLYMRTAQECGIVIPRIKLIQDKYFAAERFDLNVKGQKIHTLTAAALLKCDFRNQNLDYTNLLALTGFLTKRPEQVEQMYRRMIFNIVADNKDDHAKNFSFQCENGEWRLSPAYDLTYCPHGSNGEHATSVYWLGNPDASQVIKAGSGIRIPEARCREIIDEVQSVCAKNLDKTVRLI